MAASSDVRRAQRPLHRQREHRRPARAGSSPPSAPMAWPRAASPIPQALREAHAQGQRGGLRGRARRGAGRSAGAEMDDYIADAGPRGRARAGGAARGGRSRPGRGAAGHRARHAGDRLRAGAPGAAPANSRPIRTRCEPVVREALGLLLADGKSASVRLSPVDFDMLARAAARRVRRPVASPWLADAAVAPGDCLVESAGAVVDGGVATRWSRAVASLGLALPWHEERDRCRLNRAGLAALHGRRARARRAGAGAGAARHADAPDRPGAGSHRHPRAGRLAVPGAHGAASRRCWPKWSAFRTTAPS